MRGEAADAEIDKETETETALHGHSNDADATRAPAGIRLLAGASLSRQSESIVMDGGECSRRITQTQSGGWSLAVGFLTTCG